jgi:preprotein translocase subunit SecB
MLIENSQKKVSHLQVVRYFVTQLNIIANPLFDVTKGIVQIDSDLCITGDLSKNADDAALFQIKLNIKIQPGAESNLPYSIALEIVGVLKSSFTGTEEHIQRVVFVNGSSILYGTAREIVRSATSLGPYAQVLIPTVVFSEPPKPTVPIAEIEVQVTPPTK